MKPLLTCGSPKINVRNLTDATAMIGLHRKGKVVVSVNRVGMACGEVGNRTGLNGTYSSTTTRFLIYHGENLVAGTFGLVIWLESALVFLWKYCLFLGTRM